ncbi:MAG: transcriptional repressor [Suilimivivens sp.]
MPQKLTNDNRQYKDSANFHRTEMQREMVIQKLRERGCRITKQRQILLNVILQEECASCKEIYYKASSMDSTIGAATVYRMVNLLEEIGAISRKNMYKISCSMSCEKENICMIELDDQTVCQLSAQNWYKVISEGLKACGYMEKQKVISVMVDPCLNNRRCFSCEER